MLTPEKVLGLRGTKDELEGYALALDLIQSVGGEEGGVKVDPYFFSLDTVIQSHLALAYKFKHFKGKKVFHVGCDFARGISEIKKDIPLELLPERFMAYFSFEEGTFFETVGGKKKNVNGGFIAILPAKETPILLEGDVKADTKVIWMSYDLNADNKNEGDLNLSVACLSMPATEKHLHKVLEEQHQYAGTEKIKNFEIFRCLLNLTLYVHTKDPDLLPLRTVEKLSHSERKKQHEVVGATNHCLLPVTLVSWNYKKPISYSKDETMVSGHFRWQRFGKNFLQVKLIFIEEHQRHFKKEKGA